MSSKAQSVSVLPSRSRYSLVLVGVMALAGLSGCVTPDREYTATGAAIGTIAGAVLGHQIDDKNGRYAGGAAGALIGAAIGNNADQIRNRGYRSSGPVYDPPAYGNNRRYGYSGQRGGYNDEYQDDYNDNRGYAPYPPQQRYYRY